LDKSTTDSKSDTVGDGSQKEGEVGEWESPGVGGRSSLSCSESGDVVGELWVLLVVVDEGDAELDDGERKWRGMAGDLLAERGVDGAGDRRDRLEASFPCLDPIGVRG
jgi:hypothetical protein